MLRDGSKSGHLGFSEPKNASHHTVGLPQRIVGTLKSHRKHQLAVNKKEPTSGLEPLNCSLRVSDRTL
jgi:hypothetical protein